jgi:hypothetical protein
MPTWGITPAGFVPQPLQSIVADLQAAVLANVDPQLDLSPTQPEGQLIGILADRFAAQQELDQAVFNAFNPEDTEGAGQDNIGDLQGIPRLGASYTQVVCVLGLNVGNAPYAAGSLVANVAGQAAFTFSNPQAVTSSMISGGLATVTMQAQVIGPTSTVSPGTLTQITTPVTGWTSITNAAAQSQLGESQEDDNAYLVRRQIELATQGACTVSGVVAALYALLTDTVYPNGGGGAFSVKGIENDSDSTITAGTLTLTPHTFAIIFYDPVGLATAAQIGAVIYANKPAGIRPVGTSSYTLQDPYIFNPQTVYWTVPTPEALYISATVVPATGVVWSSLETLIQNALTAAAIAPTPASQVPPTGQLGPGSPVIGSQENAVIMGVTGTYDVQSLTFDFHSSPTNTGALAVPVTSVATLAAANIVLTQGTGP